MTGLTTADWVNAGAPPGLRGEVPLAPFTTFGVGGAAEWFVEARTTDELVQSVRAARALGVSVTVIGGGSNILVSDRGVTGLVVRARTSAIVMAGGSTVRADAGVTLNGLVRWMILRGLGGLESWAGTPGTVGGGVCGNAHYGGRLIGERLSSVSLLARSGDVLHVPAGEMAFAYDESRLQTSGEVLLSADFVVTPGQPVDDLRAVARASLLHRKRTQPLQLPSAGCVFQNPDPERDRLPDGCPASAGALVDRAGLKGHRIGGALVSPVHANFVVNAGGATASEIRELIDLCRHSVHEHFGVHLRTEIVCLGEF